MRQTLSLVVALAVCCPAFAWNDKGHMVTARLAWNKLTQEQRSKVIGILKKHPHYDEFLSVDRPNGFTEDEWVFMRAATWSDWVRNHHKQEFHHGPRHYINYPFVPPGSTIDPNAHQPGANEENVVNYLPTAVDKVTNGNDAEKAVNMCWLFHLVGDIHQPLHCTAMFSEQFPAGDQGGNKAAVVITTHPMKLHTFWDGLLGKSLTASSIGRDVTKIESLFQSPPQDVAADLKNNQSFESWGKESLEVAKKEAYLNGELEVAVVSEVFGDFAPQVPDDYAQNAGSTARIQIGKAGQRLADQIAKLFPSN